ncbi:MAG: tRNA (N(6)-L-threonylcarbamoyladenosine(37)-C(2))-methylthiotransferase MtaB [SAR202 cluster bacterium]|nr:tRNA (N(6)-L-threonylcarbamoyladenosine(37)-C(2))-methylthiotransferase MtaB [SAR202 cluster bacterium]
MHGFSTDHPPSVAIETHGCKLNQADSADLAREFVQAGYSVLSSKDSVDIYVVNTCTITHVADRKARHTIRSARRRNPEATIVAAGCYPQRSPEALSSLDEVDLIVGNKDKSTLVRQVGEWRGFVPVPCAIGDVPNAASPKIARTRAMVKIQEGCDQVCSYCIVPKVRGRERSRPSDSIVRVIGQRVQEGYKEVVLTGTQLGTYGLDQDEVTLSGLIERILDETEVMRLRVSSLQPQEIEPDLISSWANSRLCPHFHMPLQSGSDQILKKMKRRYTGEEYLNAVNLIRSMVPNAAISTDIIVGFPGETESQFSETCRLVDNAMFAKMHVFPYSERPGTSASYFSDTVPRTQILERVSRIIDLGQISAMEFRKGLVGSIRSVLWEGSESGQGPYLWKGITDNYVKVTCLSQRWLANEITDARLCDAKDEMVSVELI